MFTVPFIPLRDSIVSSSWTFQLILPFGKILEFEILFNNTADFLCEYKKSEHEKRKSKKSEI